MKIHAFGVFKICFLLFLILHVCMCAHKNVHTCTLAFYMPVEIRGIRSPGAEITGDFEPLDVSLEIKFVSSGRVSSAHNC